MNTPASEFPQGPFASHADAVERVAAATLGIALRRGGASAAVWQDGIAVTSAAAVWRAHRLQLVLPSGEPVEGRLRGIDAATDVAAIEFTGAAAPALERSPVEPRAGDVVFAVGREPSGLVQASFGHVGAAAGAWRTWRGGRIDRLLRLDGGLYDGFAGAPVADAEGRLVGIASPAFSRQHGVVLPPATVDRVLEQLLAHGRVQQGYAGVAAQPVRAQLDGDGVDGLLVSSVADDGPAAAAGLLVGDVVVAIDDEPVASLDTLREKLVVGRALAVRVARGGQAVTLTLQVAERAAEPRRGCR